MPPRVAGKSIAIHRKCSGLQVGTNLGTIFSLAATALSFSALTFRIVVFFQSAPPARTLRASHLGFSASRYRSDSLAFRLATVADARSRFGLKIAFFGRTKTNRCRVGLDKIRHPFKVAFLGPRSCYKICSELNRVQGFGSWILTDFLNGAHFFLPDSPHLLAQFEFGHVIASRVKK
jgi:hypothetical protein